MKRYSADKIKNVAVVGHGSSGKTTLCEALLYQTKTIARLGRIDDGTTASDFDPEEIKRKASLSASVLPIEFDGHKINLLDTPGRFDFASGMVEGVSCADSVLIVISGKSGVTVGAKKAYRLAKKLGKPIAFFVSKLDHANADFYKTLEQLKAVFGPSVCPLSVPVYQDDAIQCYVDLLRKVAYTYQNGKRSNTQMPNMEHRLDGLQTAISEAVAESDEELFEKYFSGEQFTQQELISGLHSGVLQGAVQPVFCGSGLTLEGTVMLLENLLALMPSAEQACADMPNDASLCARVFKTTVDPFYGKLSYIRVYRGVLTFDQSVLNARTGEDEKVGKLMMVRGKQHEEVSEIAPGDIGAAVKMAVHTGDELYLGAPAQLKTMEFPPPSFSKALRAEGDESKVSSAVTRLLQEDPTLEFTINNETHQQILSGLGEQHLEVAVAKLKAKFGADVVLEDVRVPYRETIRKKAKVQGRHKKQTGGHGQFGDVWIEFEPTVGDTLVFEEKIFGGAVPRGYFPAVEKGLRESAEHGLLAGYPMVGVKAVLVDGSYHPVDSSEMAFKTAASLAYRSGIAQASPVLLEPIERVLVCVPDANTGDMMGELNKRRGRVMGMHPDEEQENMTVIEAEAPQAELLDFEIIVRQLTQGAGSFSMEFVRYEQLPEALHSDVIAKALAENSK